MKRVWKRRSQHDAVSPVVATILLVAITVILTAVLYALVAGMTGSQNIPVQAAYSVQTIANGKAIDIISITKLDIGWTDIRVQLYDGTNFSEWYPLTEDLDGGSAIVKNYSTDALGALTVCCWMYDISGNGYVSGGDYFKIFTYGGAPAFSAGVTYTAVLIYEVSGEKIGVDADFMG